MALLPESRRDRERTYELEKTNIVNIVLIVVTSHFPFRKIVSMGKE